MTEPHYKIEHWTRAQAIVDHKEKPALVITVNDRAATRQAIINRVRQHGIEFVERSAWGAHKSRSANMTDDWNYHSVALHHAGRSHTCGVGEFQMQQIQASQMKPKSEGGINADDIGYHFALDCFGAIYEGRDIRFKGESVANFNAGLIGVVLLENLTQPGEAKDTMEKFRVILGAVGISAPDLPPQQMATLNKFIPILQEFFKIKTLGGHREFPHQKDGAGKICPGNIGIKAVQELRAQTNLSAP